MFCLNSAPKSHTLPGAEGPCSQLTLVIKNCHTVNGWALLNLPKASTRTLPVFLSYHRLKIYISSLTYSVF